MFLTDDELYALTKKQRSSAQARVLCAMGVTYRPRADGTLAVLKAHIEAMLGAAPAAPPRRRTPAAPDLSQVR